MVFDAIKFVANAHEGHCRKGTNIPYISHLTNVMKILCEHGCSETLITAGILHDVVEDTQVTLEEVRERFGHEVADLVEAATEPEKINKEQESPWRVRKEGTLHALAHTDKVGKLILSCADKLDNIRSIQQDYERIGELFWSRFNAGKEDQRWYYVSLAQILETRGQEFGEPLRSMSASFKDTVNAVFKPQ